MSFERAFNFTINHEGGYVNDPTDSGGETKFGISKRAYPRLNIKALTITQAKDIYERDYWQRAKCDKMPYPLNMAVFDYAVNAGPTKAIKALQEVVGATPDGIWGKGTVAKINEELTKNSLLGLAVKVCHHRAEFYASIVANKPNQIKFLKGWLRRVFELVTEMSNG